MRASSVSWFYCRHHHRHHRHHHYCCCLEAIIIKRESKKGFFCSPFINGSILICDLAGFTWFPLHFASYDLNVLSWASFLSCDFSRVFDFLPQNYFVWLFFCLKYFVAVFSLIWYQFLRFVSKPLFSTVFSHKLHY